MLVLLSLASIDVRVGATHSRRPAVTGVSSEVRLSQCFSACESEDIKDRFGLTLSTFQALH